MCLVGSAAGPAAGSCVGILSNFFIGNNLLLKLLRNFSFALNDSLKLFKNEVKKVLSYLYQNSLIH